MRAVLLAVTVLVGLLPTTDALGDGGGVFTLPLKPEQVTYQVNSWFDHSNPGPGQGQSYPFVRWDGMPAGPESRCLSATDCPCTLTYNCYNGHYGIDFFTNASYGLSVIASRRGTVSAAGFDPGFGYRVTIRHDDGGGDIWASSLYGHMQSNLAVSVGQHVDRGQTIGYSGCSGTCYGPHLHFGAYNAPTGGTYVDPYGWALSSGLSPDPWSFDIGHLWATRIGYFNSGGFQVKEGQVGAGYDTSITLPGSGPVTAMSIDGSRIGIVQGGTAYARDTSLNTANLGRPASNNWQMMYNNAIDIKLAGNRVGVVRSDYKLVMKEGPLDALWYENPVVADNVWKVVLTPDRIGWLHLDGSFWMKDHGPITGPWYQMMGNTNGVKDIALTDEWIGALTQYGCAHCFQAKETLNGGWLVMHGSSVASITMGGKGLDRRMGAVVAGQGKAKEDSLYDTWKPLGSAAEVALNSGRAARRESNGNVYVSEGENLGSIGGGVVGTGSGVRLN